MAQTRRHMFLRGSVPTHSPSLSIYCHCFTASCWDQSSISAPPHFLFPPPPPPPASSLSPLARPTPFSINYGQSLFHMNPLSTMGTKQMCVSELDGAIGPGAGGRGGGSGWGERLWQGWGDGGRRRLWNEEGTVGVSRWREAEGLSQPATSEHTACSQVVASTLSHYHTFPPMGRVRKGTLPHQTVFAYLSHGHTMSC